MKKLLHKISLENKRSLIVGDFNLNLIKYRQITGVNQFLEFMLTNNFTPQITIPTRINKKSATLIDNIFLSYHEHQCISGNLTTYISDHLPPFIIVENLLENIIDRNDYQIEHRDYNNFNIDAFKQWICLEQWPSGQGAGFPIQGSCVQNHWVWVAPRSTQPFHPSVSEVDKMTTRNFWELSGKMQTASSKWL